MTPLPAPLGGGECVAWRLGEARYAAGWDDGEGPFRFGGRWSPVGERVVYCALDPATAILEVAVHSGFDTLDIVPHVLTRFSFDAKSDIHVVRPDDVPNPHWLKPVQASAGQQDFGMSLLRRHVFVLIPSAVSSYSWNLLFAPSAAHRHYALSRQERFALDTRLAERPRP